MGRYSNTVITIQVLSFVVHKHLHKVRKEMSPSVFSHSTDTRGLLQWDYRLKE